MNKAEAVLFDVDGTLLDTTEFVFQAYEYTLAKHGFGRVEREVIAPLIGQPFDVCYRTLAPGGDLEVLFADHRQFQTENFGLSQPFPNTIETLDSLRRLDLKLAAITTRSKITSIQTLELAGISTYLDLVISGEDVTRQKPDPEPIHKAIGELKVLPAGSLMVGDTSADILAGKNAGIRTVGVTYGFGGEKIKEYKPDFVINDIRELVSIVSGSL